MSSRSRHRFRNRSIYICLRQDPVAVGAVSTGLVCRGQFFSAQLDDQRVEKHQNDKLVPDWRATRLDLPRQRRTAWYRATQVSKSGKNIRKFGKDKTTF
jgi:hypothetical protein